MTRLLIVEDQPSDLRVASELAQSLGFSDVEARTSALAARVYLEKCLDGEAALPEVIVLDLDLGYESGFELLRYWHGTPRLAEIPMVVWTVLGEEQREICKLFRVSAFVSKLDDSARLKEALGCLVQSTR